MNKLLGIVVGAAALAMGSVASAITVTEGSAASATQSSPSLGGGTAVIIEINDIVNDGVSSAFEVQGSFTNDTLSNLALQIATLNSAGFTPPAIEDLTVTFFSDMFVTAFETIAITDSIGDYAPGLNVVGGAGVSGLDLSAVATGMMVYYSITGSAIPAGSNIPDISLRIEEVPIPGALPLLLSGLAGLGFAARRKKASA